MQVKEGEEEDRCSQIPGGGRDKNAKMPKLKKRNVISQVTQTQKPQVCSWCPC